MALKHSAIEAAGQGKQPFEREVERLNSAGKQQAALLQQQGQDISVLKQELQVSNTSGYTARQNHSGGAGNVHSGNAAVWPYLIKFRCVLHCKARPLVAAAEQGLHISKSHLLLQSCRTIGSQTLNMDH